MGVGGSLAGGLVALLHGNSLRKGCKTAKEVDSKSDTKANK